MEHPIHRVHDPVVQPPCLTFRKYGNLLEMSEGGVAPPRPFLNAVAIQLVCRKTIFLYGKERYERSHDGSARNVDVEFKQLYTVDEHGRIVCPHGFLRRMLRLATELGYPVDFHDVTPPRPRPGCYEPDWDSVRRRFQFRPRQEECLRAIADSPNGGLVEAVTGFGKMVMMAMTCCLYPRAEFDLTVKSADLAKKTQVFMSRWLPSVGLTGAGSRTRGRVTVYTADSLHHCPFDADFLIGDEVHQLLADSHSAELSRSEFPRRLAFTASPEGRSDGTDIRLEAFFGNRIFHITYQEAVDLGLVVPIRVEWSDVRLTANPCAGMAGPTKEKRGIWTNDARNRVIAQRANEFGPGEQVQILVRTIEHAVHLRQHLPDYTLVYGDMEQMDRIRYTRQGLLPADEPLMTPARRDMLRKQFEAGDLKKVISTSVWATGIDPTQLVALVRADAGSSQISDIQSPGRVSRRAEGKSVGVVCDFRDQFDQGYAGKAKTREKHYRALGWEQVSVGAKS